MPRIKKQGLDYFPLNTDFIHDRLVRRIMKREGDASLSVLIEVLSYIYSGEGYYVCADALFYEDLSSNLYEKTSDDIRRIVSLAVEYGIFDAALHAKYGILTSADIQRQYLFSTKRRNVSHLDPAYCLISEELLVRPSGKNGAGNRSSQSRETVNSVNETSMESSVTADEQGRSDELEVNVNRAENGSFIPENVTSGTHSIAQNSIAEHSVAKNRKDSPSPSSPEAECGNTESGNPKGEEEKEKEERGGKEGGKEENFLEKNTEAPLPSKRREWTNETLSELQPPTDGIGRNYDGLLYNMRLYGIPPMEQYAIIRKSNFGAIGEPVWKGFCALRDSCGKIKMPGRYLLSVMNR